MDREKGLVSRVGPLEIDWPRSLGYFGAAWLAVTTEIVAPPVGWFIAAVPFLKMLTKSDSPRPIRFTGQVVEGAAKPIGGDSEGTVRFVTGEGSSDQ